MSAALLLAAVALLLDGRAAPADRLSQLRHRARGAEAGHHRVAAAIESITRRAGARLGAAAPVRSLTAAAALNLIAACLRAGLDTAAAVTAVAGAADPAITPPLRATAARLELGAADAWAPMADSREFAEAARLARRAAESGTALAAGLAELAAGYRAAAGDSAEAAAERAGVLIAGPLALCFLPAFMLLGLVPVIVGLAGPMLEGMSG